MKNKLIALSLLLLSFVPAKALEEFEHEIESTVFVPKGVWVGGVSVSYSQSTQNNYQFFVLEHLKGDTYSFKVSPMVCYIFKDDMGAGGRFAYTRSLTKLETADIVLDAETEVNMENLYRLSHDYYFTGIFRNYFSLNSSKRFGFFNELQLQLGGGQSKLMQGKGTSLTGNYERNFSFDVGIAPGLAVFLNNYSAVEVQVGVLGFSLRDTKTITDQVYVARRKAMAANFYINLFSINFGVSFYL
ncbi:MAG: hypothetical protein J1E97_02025 [Muribaculaceae bacterium]|nr:hypothetical protein [Muribaculaceae bacterium]